MYGSFGTLFLWLSVHIDIKKRDNITLYVAIASYFSWYIYILFILKGFCPSSRKVHIGVKNDFLMAPPYHTSLASAITKQAWICYAHTHNNSYTIFLTSSTARSRSIILFFAHTERRGLSIWIKNRNKKKKRWFF
jgi:hypothetical protein